MIEATVITDAPILLANNEHKNFTETSDVIKSGEKIKGSIKKIQGLRRGKPFEYRLFLTDNGKFIYLNKIKPMERTEVNLGADASVSPTVVNTSKPLIAEKNKVAGTLIGAIAGFAYAKYKKEEAKKTLTYVVIGAALGLGAAFIYDKGKSKVTVKPSK